MHDLHHVSAVQIRDFDPFSQYYTIQGKGPGGARPPPPPPPWDEAFFVFAFLSVALPPKTNPGSL